MQTLTWSRRVPLPRVFHCSLGQSVLLIQDVVKDHDVTAASGHCTAFADEERLPAALRVPPASSLGVRRQAHAGEEFLVLVFINKVTDHPAKALSQLGGVRTDDQLAVRNLAHHVGREQIATKLGLAVPGRHGNHQALAFASNDAVKGFRDDLMVFPNEHLGPHVFAEIKKAGGGFLLGLQQLEA